MKILGYQKNIEGERKLFEQKYQAYRNFSMLSFELEVPVIEPLFNAFIIFISILSGALIKINCCQKEDILKKKQSLTSAINFNLCTG